MMERRDLLKAFLAATGALVIPLGLSSGSSYPVWRGAERQLYGHTVKGWWRIPNECTVETEIERTDLHTRDSAAAVVPKPVATVIAKEADTVVWPDGRRERLVIDMRSGHLLRYYEVAA